MQLSLFAPHVLSPLYPMFRWSERRSIAHIEPAMFSLFDSFDDSEAETLEANTRIIPPVQFAQAA